MCVLPLIDEKGVTLRASVINGRRLLKVCRQFFQVPDLQEIGDDASVQLLNMEEKLVRLPLPLNPSLPLPLWSHHSSPLHPDYRQPQSGRVAHVGRSDDRG